MGACKEVSCYSPLALAVFSGLRSVFSWQGRQLPAVPRLLPPASDHLASTYLTLRMADEDVATRAPESDAKEPSALSSEDTPAQKGASMGVRYAAPHDWNATD